MFRPEFPICFPGASNRMVRRLVDGQFAGMRLLVRTFLLLLCLTIVVQGGHVCLTPPHDGPGMQTEVGPQSIPCTVCAIAHSLSIVAIFLLLLVLPTCFSVDAVAIQARSFLDGFRLLVRPPPAAL